MYKIIENLDFINTRMYTNTYTFLKFPLEMGISLIEMCTYDVFVCVILDFKYFFTI